MQRKGAFYLCRVLVDVFENADRDGWVDGGLRDQPVRHIERHLSPKRNILKHFQDFDLKANAKIWP